MKTLFALLLLIPSLSWGEANSNCKEKNVFGDCPTEKITQILKNVEKIECLYHRKKDLITLEVYNNNDKDIKSVTLNLTNKENNKVYKFKEEKTVDAYSSSTIWFWNIFFEPIKCRISDVEFKGWFD